MIKYFVVLCLSLLLVDLHRTVFCLSYCAFGGFTQVCIDTAKKIMCLSFMSIMTQQSCVVTGVIFMYYFGIF